MFRLTMARQRGERIAQQHGFTSFPVDPFKIAEAEEIDVEAKDPEHEGVSGCIIFHNNGVGIIYATHIRSEGFQRFTVAHELGHYFLDGHEDEIRKSSPIHLSRAGFTQGQSWIEIEADHFAAGLLMPSRLTRASLARAPIGLAGVQYLANDAETSLTAAAIRTAECASYPVAVVVSRGGQVAYGFLSEGFKRLGRLRFLRKGDSLPATFTRTFNADPEKVRQGRMGCGATTLAAWFDGPSHVELDEEVIGLGKYGYTLTVLSSEALPDDPDEQEDEEQELIESWTPRHAYGR